MKGGEGRGKKGEVGERWRLGGGREGPGRNREVGRGEGRLECAWVNVECARK